MRFLAFFLTGLAVLSAIAAVDGLGGQLVPVGKLMLTCLVCLLALHALAAWLGHGVHHPDRLPDQARMGPRHRPMPTVLVEPPHLHRAGPARRR